MKQLERNLERSREKNWRRNRKLLDFFYLYDLGCFILMSLIIELTFLDNDVSRGGKELKV